MIPEFLRASEPSRAMPALAGIDAERLDRTLAEAARFVEDVPGERSCRDVRVGQICEDTSDIRKYIARRRAA